MNVYTYDGYVSPPDDSLCATFVNNNHFQYLRYHPSVVPRTQLFRTIKFLASTGHLTAPSLPPGSDLFGARGDAANNINETESLWNELAEAKSEMSNQRERHEREIAEWRKQHERDMNEMKDMLSRLLRMQQPPSFSLPSGEFMTLPFAASSSCLVLLLPCV